LLERALDARVYVPLTAGVSEAATRPGWRNISLRSVKSFSKAASLCRAPRRMSTKGRNARGPRDW